MVHIKKNFFLGKHQTQVLTSHLDDYQHFRSHVMLSPQEGQHCLDFRAISSLLYSFTT